MNITVSMPASGDPHSQHRVLRAFEVALRANFPAIKDIAFEVVPRFNDNGFSHFPHVGKIEYSLPARALSPVMWLRRLDLTIFFNLPQRWRAHYRNTTMNLRMLLGGRRPNLYRVASWASEHDRMDALLRCMWVLMDKDELERITYVEGNFTVANYDETRKPHAALQPTV